jgi:hypothetical protein
MFKYLFYSMFLLPSFLYASFPVDLESAKDNSLNFIAFTPNTFIDSNNDLWDAFANKLVSLSSIDAMRSKITLLVNGYGGDVNEVFKVSASIERAKEKGVVVDMEVIGQAISGHAYLLCAANKVTFREGSSVVFHAAGNYNSLFFKLFSYRTIGKDIETTTLSLPLFKSCVRNNLLTLEEVMLVSQGKRITITYLNGQFNRYVNEDYNNEWSNMFAQLIYIGFLFCVLILLIYIIKRI